MEDFYRGRKVLFSDDGELCYWSNLFYMLADSMGVECCMMKDPEVQNHFQAILDRLNFLSRDSEVSEIVTLFLSD